MCLIIFAYKTIPGYELIFASNRDEFYNRPTEQAKFWEEDCNILAGKDLKQGGTWMGISKTGKFAALTNFRDKSLDKKNPKSRGFLVKDFIAGTGTSENYKSALKDELENYSGFNLLTYDRSNFIYINNKNCEVEKLSPGFYGLSNGLLDENWFKVEKSKTAFQKIVNVNPEDQRAVFNLLKDNEKAPDQRLPDTGIGKLIEKQVSSIFIKTPIYGTRCSTFLSIRDNGEVRFVEETHYPKNLEKPIVDFNFSLK